MPHDHPKKKTKNKGFNLLEFLLGEKLKGQLGGILRGRGENKTTATPGFGGPLDDPLFRDLPPSELRKPTEPVLPPGTDPEEFLIRQTELDTDTFLSPPRNPVPADTPSVFGGDPGFTEGKELVPVIPGSPTQSRPDETFEGQIARIRGTLDKAFPQESVIPPVLSQEPVEIPPLTEEEEKEQRIARRLKRLGRVSGNIANAFTVHARNTPLFPTDLQRDQLKIQEESLESAREDRAERLRQGQERIDLIKDRDSKGKSGKDTVRAIIEKEAIKKAVFEEVFGSGVKEGTPPGFAASIENAGVVPSERQLVIMQGMEDKGYQQIPANIDSRGFFVIPVPKDGNKTQAEIEFLLPLVEDTLNVLITPKRGERTSQESVVAARATLEEFRGATEKRRAEIALELKPIIILERGVNGLHFEGEEPEPFLPTPEREEGLGSIFPKLISGIGGGIGKIGKKLKDAELDDRLKQLRDFLLGEGFAGSTPSKFSKGKKTGSVFE